MKDIIENYFSSFPLPKTIVIESSTNFSHVDSLWEIIQLLASNAHIFEHGLQFVGAFIATTTLDIMIILKKDASSFNLASSSKGGNKTWLGPMFLP
jgi:hypothetical protein